MIPTASSPDDPGDGIPWPGSGSEQSPYGAGDVGTPPSESVPNPPSADAAAPLAPDDLLYRHGLGRRVYYTARQRRLDLAALGRLALALPSFLMSVLVVLVVSVTVDVCFGLPFWIPALGWLASGALVFHGPTEALLARYLFGLHRPVPQEAARLEPVWREVTSLSGVDGRWYQLWIEESADLNALAAAGHIVAVTRFALEQLPSAQLAAVLAHELGHHTGGHAWTSLLGHWYAAPGRAVWRVVRSAVRTAVTPARCALYLAVGGVLLAAGLLPPTLVVLWALPPVLVVLPYVEAAVGRWAELLADRHAAELGFAPMLVEVLQTLHVEEVKERRATLLANEKASEPASVPDRLLSSHPDVATRIHRLRPYLEQRPY